MVIYKIKDISKTLDKVFDSGLKQTAEIKKLKWEDLDKKVPNLTPFEKSLVMDFVLAIKSNKVIEFLAGKEIKKKGIGEND